jgi:hypothetical protein
MPLNIIAQFFDIINLPLFDSVSVILIISFLIWEIPRTIKVISEEYTKGIYPDGGRIPDIFLFIVGLAAIGFFLAGDNGEQIVRFVKTPGVIALYIILMVTIPLIILLGFFKRFFGRMDHHESITVFVVHGFLDLAHTVFFAALAILVIPAIGFLIGLH